MKKIAKLYRAKKFLVSVANGEVDSGFGSEYGKMDFCEICSNAYGLKLIINDTTPGFDGYDSGRMYLESDLYIDTETKRLTSGKYSVKLPDSIISEINSILEDCFYNSWTEM